MKIIIESIDYQHVMPTDAYEWLIGHLNEELQVASIDFNTQRGGVFCISVVADKCDDRVAVIFEANHAKFKLVGLEELSCIDTI